MYAKLCRLQGGDRRFFAVKTKRERRNKDRNGKKSQNHRESRMFLIERFYKMKIKGSGFQKGAHQRERK